MICFVASACDRNAQTHSYLKTDKHTKDRISLPRQNHSSIDMANTILTIHPHLLYPGKFKHRNRALRVLRMTYRNIAVQEPIL